MFRLVFATELLLDFLQDRRRDALSLILRMSAAFSIFEAENFTLVG